MSNLKPLCLTLYNPSTSMYHLYRVGKDGLVQFQSFGPAEPRPR